MRIKELLSEAFTELFPLKTETLKLGSEGNVVKAWQWSLNKLSEKDVSIDGKFGERTKKATVEFQNDNNITNDGVVGKETYSMANRELSAIGVTRIPFLKDGKAAQEPKQVSRDITEARTSAESYLGRSMSDTEWEYLIRAVYAESSPNSKEQAYIMGVILNRVKSGKWGDTVISVLKAKNQFQAVTGTKFAPGPSINFRSGPSSNSLDSIVSGAIDILPKVPDRLMNFTAASIAAYGKGTNPKFRDQLLARGGVIIGGTIFA
jgi:peptidoglycan hydrolase-like protein with peptidoglycan-binding domain